LTGPEGNLADPRARAVRLEYLTIGWNSLEAIVALIAGFVAGSVALIGFGLDSIIEVFAAGVVLWQLRTGREEARALRLIGGTFFALAAYVAIESIRDLAVEAKPNESLPGLVVTSLSLVVMFLLASAKHRTGHQLDSLVLIADSKETLLCSYLSGVVLIGLAANAALGWWWADPLAGLGIAALAIREGTEAVRGSHPEHHSGAG
jgi:divalent metal cation (Fe/Co/Zn/Cd) transporter